MKYLKKYEKNEEFDGFFKWIKLIKWIKEHRKEGNASFHVVTNADTFIITVDGTESTEESWSKNMLRIKF
ncbi:hypothetical protein M0Q97_06975 [Candidatus Dojkabacteria bacterium]|jgi:hypothetical protein|nr:hypothetical protein [Candidatus Dojkabacteria bacterium]